jgi:putative tricarboxylic transport membrane protein
VKKVFLKIGFAGFAILLAVVFYIHTLNLPKAAYQLPRILIGVVFLLSIGMVIEQVLFYRKNHQDDSNKESTPVISHQRDFKVEELKVRYRRIFVFIVLIWGYIIMIERLGYFIATPIYIIVTYLYLKATKFYKMVLIAAGFTIFVYLLFVLFLHLPVPMGLLD